MAWKNDKSIFVFHRRRKCCFWRDSTENPSGKYYDTFNAFNCIIHLSSLSTETHLYTVHRIQHWTWRLKIEYLIKYLTLLRELLYCCYLVCYSQHFPLYRGPGERRLTPKARMTRILFLQLLITRLTGFPILCKELGWRGCDRNWNYIIINYVIQHCTVYNFIKQKTFHLKSVNI